MGAGTLTFDSETVPARFGRNGACAAEAKREGDGMTPYGSWPLRTLLLRPDRALAAPKTLLPWRWLRRNDGWSDDAADPAYNRPVQHPHDFSAERLWRDDGAYDVVLVLGHNDAPPVPGLGSAIFLHCEQPDGRATEGCVAVARDVLLRWLPLLASNAAIEIGK
nr:L,D-transpeptidase family protein [Polymorphobacter multimanifer]